MTADLPTQPTLWRGLPTSPLPPTAGLHHLTSGARRRRPASLAPAGAIDGSPRRKPWDAVTTDAAQSPGRGERTARLSAIRLSTRPPFAMPRRPRPDPRTT